MDSLNSKMQRRSLVECGVNVEAMFQQIRCNVREASKCCQMNSLSLFHLIEVVRPDRPTLLVRKTVHRIEFVDHTEDRIRPWSGGPCLLFHLHKNVTNTVTSASDKREPRYSVPWNTTASHASNRSVMVPSLGFCLAALLLWATPHVLEDRQTVECV